MLHDFEPGSNILDPPEFPGNQTIERPEVRR
jgi:hypothetical protein